MAVKLIAAKKAKEILREREEVITALTDCYFVGICPNCGKDLSVFTEKVIYVRETRAFPFRTIKTEEYRDTIPIVVCPNNHFIPDTYYIDNDGSHIGKAHWKGTLNNVIREERDKFIREDAHCY